MKKEKIRNLVAIFLIILFTFSIVPKTFQNDTFYIIELGNQIAKTGVDWQDHYSIHENLEYRYPHWAFDIINSKVYGLFGYDGIYVLTQIFATIFMLIVFWNMRRKEINFCLSLASTFILAYFMKDAFSARGQILSFSLFLLEYMILENFVYRPTFFKTLALFLLSVIMANVHSTAWIMMLVLVLPFIGEQIIYAFGLKGLNEILLKKYKKQYKNAKEKGISNNKLAKIEENIKHQEEFKIKFEAEEKNKEHKIIIEKKPNIKYIWVAIIVLFLGALCTPLKLTPIIYVLKTSIGNSMGYINEHLPIVPANSLIFLTYTIIIVALIGFTNSKLKLYDAFLILGLYFMSLSGRRNVFLLTGLTTGIIVKMIDEFVKINSNSKNLKKGKDFFIIICIASVLCSIYFFFEKRNDEFADEKMYPIKAVEYIKENLDYKNIRMYNSYEYGSYLLMQGIPVFIDSRCDLYTPEFNKGVIVFDDYMDVQFVEKSIFSLIDKYNLEYALVYKKSVENTYLVEDERFIEIYKDNDFVLYRYNK